jgi:transposase
MAPANRKSPKRSTASESRYSLVEFMRDFPDDETCLRFLWDTRYNLGDTDAHCERCGEIRRFRRYTAKQQRQDWTCTACGLHVHPTAGTIFHKSSTSLHLWFYAMYLMTSTRCGISAKQLERELGVTYKTAWRMFTLIRNELMEQDDEPMTGVVEMDETFVGGKPRNSDRAKWSSLPDTMHRRQAAQRWSDQQKAAVFGMVERNRVHSYDGEPKPTVVQRGKAAAYVVPSIQAATVGEHIDRRVTEGTVVYTDEGKSYRGLRRQGWQHATVNHSEREYVRGTVHTNTIEGFWSLVKRGITGSHHWVSRKWLQGYLNEYVWRYNHRDDNGPDLFALLVVRSAFPVSR